MAIVPVLCFRPADAPAIFASVACFRAVFVEVTVCVSTAEIVGRNLRRHEQILM